MRVLTRTEANKALYDAILLREQERDKSGLSDEWYRLDKEVEKARMARYKAIAREG